MNINATLIGQSISFLFFVLFCTKYIWPPIINALNERQKKIADSIEAAHRADKKIIQSKQIAEVTIENANKQATNIIDRAKKQSQQIIDAAKQQAIKDAELIIYEANKETEQQIQQAKAKLRVRLADLIVIGAEKLISDKFDKSANDEYIKQLTCKL